MLIKPRNFKNLILLVFILGVLLIFISCDKDKKKKIKFVAIDPGATPTDVYNKGEKLYQKKRYEESIEQFEALKNNFPYDELADEARLRIADGYFGWKQYIQASESYELFRKLHPLHERSDYAMYKQVESLYKECPKTIDRDLTLCKRPLELTDVFFMRYPDSEYSDEVKKISDDSKALLAGHEFYVGRFYYRTKKYKAAAKRLEGLLQNHAGYGFELKGSYYLGRSYLKLSADEDARRVYQAMVDQYPNNSYTEKLGKKINKLPAVTPVDQTDTGIN